MNNKSEPPVALALSGGGVRAMVFHLGVLRFLAERGLLERITHISTVSGGSLVLGLIFQENGLQWPSSKQFLNETLPRLRKKLCDRSLLGDSLRQLLVPANWRYLFSRANLVAGALQANWGVSGDLSDLPVAPEWSINGTTAETGKRFRFKRNDLGDWELGYAKADKFPLANAMAVSAAFPGGIGPLVIRSKQYQWMYREWGQPEASAKPRTPAFKKLHLYDGGVYDNLGLEPFFDAGKRAPKSSFASNVVMVVSDASAPLQRGFSFGSLNPWRLKRVADIMSEQTRALRVRMFVDYVRGGDERGSYLYIGQSLNRPVFDQLDSASEKCGSAEFAAGFPTTLGRLTEIQFDRIFMHGYHLSCKYDDEVGIFGRGSKISR